MNDLYFITGNKGKLAEAQVFIPQLKSLVIDLPEIQSIDSKDIITAKLTEAKKHHSGNFIVDDVSLVIDGMNGLPGPLVKYFEKTIGLEGIAKIAQVYGDKATVTCSLGYANGTGIAIFEGVVKGTIVLPRGANGFGWDKIFVPDGYTKTFAEMSPEEKSKVSHRKRAFELLKQQIRVD